MRKPSDSWATCNSHAPSILPLCLKVEQHLAFVNKPLSLTLPRGLRAWCLFGCQLQGGLVCVCDGAHDNAHASDCVKQPELRRSTFLSTMSSLVCHTSASLELIHFPSFVLQWRFHIQVESLCSFQDRWMMQNKWLMAAISVWPKCDLLTLDLKKTEQITFTKVFFSYILHSMKKFALFTTDWGLLQKWNVCNGVFQFNVIYLKRFAPHMREPICTQWPKMKMVRPFSFKWSKPEWRLSNSAVLQTCLIRIFTTI